MVREACWSEKCCLFKRVILYVTSILSGQVFARYPDFEESFQARYKHYSKAKKNEEET